MVSKGNQMALKCFRRESGVFADEHVFFLGCRAQAISADCSRDQWGRRRYGCAAGVYCAGSAGVFAACLFMVGGIARKKRGFDELKC